MHFQNSASEASPTVTELPNTALHLAADTGVETTANGRVTNWKSSAGNIASQNVPTARPQLVPNAVNGQPALRFNGGHFLTVEGEVLSQERCTIIAVARDTAPKPGLREIISNWNGAAGNSTTSVFLGLRDTGGVRFSDQFSPAGEISDGRRPFILSAVNGADGARVWQNGILIASRTQPLTGRKFGTQWVIGTQGNINGEYWHGDIAEILVFAEPLSYSELDSIWTSLHRKYRIPRSVAANLPVTNSTPEHRALASLCHVLLNSNEFLYVD